MFEQTFPLVRKLYTIFTYFLFFTVQLLFQLSTRVCRADASQHVLSQTGQAVSVVCAGCTGQQERLSLENIDGFVLWKAAPFLLV